MENIRFPYLAERIKKNFHFNSGKTKTKKKKKIFFIEKLRNRKKKKSKKNIMENGPHTNSPFSGQLQTGQFSALSIKGG